MFASVHRSSVFCHRRFIPQVVVKRYLNRRGYSYGYMDILDELRLRRIIREAIQAHVEEEIEEEGLDQGHEPSTSLYQMNHQGDGERYDQMGKQKKRR